MIVTAVDPGHRWTAVVTRDLSHPNRTRGGGLLAWRVIDAAKDLPDRQLLTIVAEVLDEVREQVVAPKAAHDGIVVEGVNGPTGFAGGQRAPLDPTQLITTAAVMGSVVGAFNAAVVDPGHYGAPQPSRRHLLALYPDELVGARERTGSGKTPIQHARAAWDIAHAGGLLLRRRTRTKR